MMNLSSSLYIRFEKKFIALIIQVSKYFGAQYFFQKSIQWIYETFSLTNEIFQMYFAIQRFQEIKAIYIL